MLKIFDGEKVYIRVEDIKAAGLDDIYCFFNDNHCDTFDSEYGILVPEASFNRELLKLYPESYENMEITKVNSLSVKLKDIKSIRPLKFLFLKGFGEDEESIKKRIFAEEREDIEKAIKNLKNQESSSLLRYNRISYIWKSFGKTISQKLSPAGLTLQFFTCVCDSLVGVMVFISGKSVFYQIYFFEDITEEDIESIKVYSDNSVMFSQPQEYEEVHIIPEEVDRDFKQFSVRENLLWCLENLELKNDFTDELNYNGTGISISISTKVFLKLFNNKAFPNEYYFEGLPSFKETVCTV